jgi:protein-S-isoprenylcysteine O-methyltransferase Ste14
MELSYITSPLYQTILGAALFIWLAPELIGLFFQRSRGSAQSQDHGSIFLLLVTKIAGIFFAILLAIRARFAAFSWHPGLWFFLGILLMICGVLFRWYSIRYLGSSFTRNVAVQPGQTVVQDGPYRLIRHPSYTGTLITTLGFGLALGNGLSLLCALLCWGIGHSYRVHVEEKALASSLGRPYQDYMRRTRRFIPYIF